MHPSLLIRQKRENVFLEQLVWYVDPQSSNSAGDVLNIMQTGHATSG